MSWKCKNGFQLSAISFQFHCAGFGNGGCHSDSTFVLFGPGRGRTIIAQSGPRAKSRGELWDCIKAGTRRPVGPARRPLTTNH